MNAVDEILGEIRKYRNIDFSSYRIPTARRRIQFRIKETGLSDSEYISYLRNNPGELDQLISALTIKVSSFFRTPPVYRILDEEVIPEVTARKKHVAVWSAGCAMGEEPYSMSILLKEHGKRQPGLQTFIYATDIDSAIIEKARKGIYPAEALRGLPPDLRRRYFRKISAQEKNPERQDYLLSNEIRSGVVFNRLDITGNMTGVSFSQCDIILCRNVLIYYDMKRQPKILGNIEPFLSKRGYLVLGEYESLPADLRERFSEIRPGSKIFQVSSMGHAEITGY